MWLFGSRSDTFKVRISELEAQLAVASKTIAEERKTSDTLRAEVRELEAVSLNALEEIATEVLGELEQAATSCETIREAITALHRSKGVVIPVRDRCLKYTQRLNAVDQELPALTTAFREWNRLILAVKQRLGAPSIDPSVAFTVIASVDSLADDMLAEEYKDFEEAALIKSIKRHAAERQKMREERAESERRRRAGIRNPKVAAAALPQPNRQTYTVPKGIKELAQIPPSSR